MRALRVPTTVLAVAFFGVLFPSGSMGVLVLPAEQAASVVGLWEAPRPSEVEAIHTALLPSGKVLFYENNHGVRLYDPVAGTLTAKPLPWGNNLFCSGHTQLPDGRLLVFGGTLPVGYGFAGEKTSFFFDPWTESWSKGPDMATGRWYPTPVTLGDGRVIVFSGLDATGATTPLVETFDGTAWSVVSGADRYQSLYPRMLLKPDGGLVRAGHEPDVVFFDPATGVWRGGPHMGTDRWQGSAVLLPGLDRVLAVGGMSGGNTVASATLLDLGAETATPTGSLAVPRHDLNLVLLPDGTVLATGGANGPPMPHPGVLDTLGHLHPQLANTFGWLDGAMFRYPSALNAERYDPETGTWSVLAAAQKSRTYHSTALLLPDGSVFTAGSDIETIPTQPPLYETSRTIERFLPPYLFRGTRPVIDSAPEAIGHGASFEVSSTTAPYVEEVVIVKLGSVTHGFNFGQRLLALDFDVVGTTLAVTGPADGNAAPPGWYMLFLVDADGVPSHARMVRVG